MATQAQIETIRRNGSRNVRQNDKIEPNPDLQTPLAASLATRETAPDPQSLEITKSNPIATTEEAAKGGNDSGNLEIEPNRVPDDEGAIADPSPGIAISGLCAAEST